jgi:hypothetical protein
MDKKIIEQKKNKKLHGLRIFLHPSTGRAPQPAYTRALPLLGNLSRHWGTRDLLSARQDFVIRSHVATSQFIS